jgi:diguanylate cyclase (GGDEF)-like protein
MACSTGDRPVVLIVDGNEATRTLERAAVEDEGMLAVEAQSGSQLLSTLVSIRPDLVVLELATPGTDPLDTCRALRQGAGNEDIPILILTGSEDLESIDRAYESDATDFMEHPVNWTIFKRRIRYLVRGGRARAQLRKLVDQVRTLAYYDPLTGLPNRLLYKEYLTKVLARAQRTKELVAVIFLDVDHFKRINDTLGHDVGDEVIREAAHRMQDSLREGDTISRLGIEDGRADLARVGGDEFYLLVPQLASNSDAAKIATRLLRAFDEPFRLGSREITITASIGIAVSPDDGRDAEVLLKHADTAMYRAKDDGRAQFQFFDTGMGASASRRLELEHGLRTALEREELSLFYQPIIDAKSRSVVGTEALLRWQHPELGMVYPGEFIPVAEECGAIIPLGEWVLETACRQVRAWRDRGLALWVSVNLSARQIRDHSFVEIVGRVLAQNTLDPSCLILELTESILMHREEESTALLSELKSLGVGLSIDDFGTGYSSLSYLKHFPLDNLKIDRSFVQGIPDDREDVAITGAIIALAHSLGLKVTAEGVETQEHLESLCAYGCDEIQGYLYSPPIPPDALEEYLQTFGDG